MLARGFVPEKAHTVAPISEMISAGRRVETCVAGRVIESVRISRAPAIFAFLRSPLRERGARRVRE